MHLHTFRTEQLLPSAPASVFPFFADARNLERITPAWLNFQVVTLGSIEMRRGALIDYRIRLHGMPLRWRTEIREWDPPHRFVDVQLRGPYRMWHHTHTFAAVAGGTLCRDEVRYAVPGGRLLNWLFVRREVRAIFAYRTQALRRVFSEESPNVAPAAGSLRGAQSDRFTPRPCTIGGSVT